MNRLIVQWDACQPRREAKKTRSKPSTSSAPYSLGYVVFVLYNKEQKEPDVDRDAIDYIELNKDREWETSDSITEYSARQAIRRCFPSLRPDLSVLDYGCSIGRASKVFKESGFIVTGVDVIEERLKEAAEVCDQTFLRVNMKQKLPFSEGEFDLVFASLVIEHLCTSDAFVFFNEAHRLLKPKGKVFVSTPNPHYARIIMQHLPMIRGPHLSCWSIEDIKHNLHEVGFRNIKNFGSGRMASYIGDRFPCRWIYAAFAVNAEKVPLRQGGAAEAQKQRR